MGKRKRAEKKNQYCGEGEGNITSCKGYGGRNKNNDFAVFEFDSDDYGVEKESRKSLAKSGIESPSKKPSHHRQQVDKYTYLERFANGNTTQRKDTRIDMLDVDVTDCSSRNITSGNDMRISPAGSTKHQGFECSSHRAKSCAPEDRKPGGGCRTSKLHNNVLYVDSDEDGPMGLTSGSSFDLGENEGSPVQLSSEYGANNNDCEAVVVVDPHYVIYAKMRYTKCRLTFSQRCIRLEVPPFGERKITYSIEWSASDILEIEHEQCKSVKADVVNLHFKPKDTNVVDSGNWNSDSVELEFVVLHDPQWSLKLEDIKLLDLNYKAAWKIITSECNFDESFVDIVYPDGDPDAVFISRKDIELLQPRTFINDTIIDFYIKYLVNKTSSEKQHMFHFFNTFFFQKLMDNGRDLSRTWEGSDGRDAFQRVRKWTKNVNFFEKDYVFIPVNYSLHWSLIVICHPGEIASLRDKGMDSSSKVPCILHMDSLKGSHGGFENLIRSYLLEEWKERGSKQDEDISLKFINLDFIALQLPKQENWYDCGLFLLHYAELFLEQAPNFGATKYVEFLNKNWFLADEVSLKKRDHIRKLIHGLSKDNALKEPQPARKNEHLQRIIDNSSDESDIKRQKTRSSMLEQTNIGNSVIDECLQLVPYNQFNNMILPREGALWNQEGIHPIPGDNTSSGYEADGEEERRPQCYLLPICEKTEVSRETCSSSSPIMIDTQNDDEDNDCVSEVACSMEEQKDRYSITSMSSEEDLEAIVIEDSEEESETESIRRGLGNPVS